MTYELLCKASEDETLWLEARKEGIGSSDAPAIMGRSPWASPLSVYLDKMGVPQDRPDGAELDMKWGKHMEEPILLWLNIHWGLPIEQTTRNQLIRSKRCPAFMRATIDAWTNTNGDRVPVEVKTSRVWGDWGQGETGIPDHVWIQMQHQLAVVGAPYGYVVSSVCGGKPDWRQIYKDEAFISAELIPEEEAFWEKVLASTPPAADSHPATSKALTRMFPKDNGQGVPLGGAFLHMDEERTIVDAEIKTLETTKKGIDNRIKEALGDNTEGILTDGTIYTWKANRNGTRVLRRKGAPNG